MGFFSKIGNAFKQAASRASAPFRRNRPAAPTTPPQPTQAPRPTAPAAPSQAPASAPAPQGPVHTPGPSRAPKSQGQLDHEAQQRALDIAKAKRREEMEEARRARSEANRLKNLDNFTEEGDDEDYLSGASGKMSAADQTIAPAPRNSDPWYAAQRYIYEEGADLGAQTFIVRSGKHKGETHQRPAISTSLAIGFASIWFKRMDETGIEFSWLEKKMIRNRTQIVEVRGLSSAAYLADKRPGYHSKAPSFHEIWAKLGPVLGEDLDVMPYRGIW